MSALVCSFIQNLVFKLFSIKYAKGKLSLDFETDWAHLYDTNQM